MPFRVEQCRYPCRTCRCAWPGMTPTGPGASAPRPVTNHSATSSRTSRRRRTACGSVGRRHAVDGHRGTDLRRASTSGRASCAPGRSRRARTHNYAWKRSGPHASLRADHPADAALQPGGHPVSLGDARELRAVRDAMGHFPVDAGAEERVAELMRDRDGPTRHGSRTTATRRPCSTRSSLPCARRSRSIFMYAKDIPLVEEREPGERYLIGAGFVEGVDPAVEWEYSEPRPSALDHVGARRRPLDPAGLHQRLPAALSASSSASPALQGEDLEPVRRPGAARPLRRVLVRLGARDARRRDRGADRARARGRAAARRRRRPMGARSRTGSPIGSATRGRRAAPYPGMGPMLAAAGLERGPLLARRVLDNLPDGVRPVARARATPSQRTCDRLVGRRRRKAFEQLHRGRGALPAAARHVALRA